MVTLDNLVVTTALPVIRADLGAALGELEWTVNAYTLTFAVLLLTGAALGDRFGRRRMFAIGLGIFTARLGRRRARAVDRRARRRARRAGRRRRDRDAAHADDPLRGRPAGAARPRARRLGRHRRPRRRARPARRRRRRQRHLVALDLLAQRADRARARPARAAAARRDATARRAGSTCPASRSRAPACSGSSGASSAATRSAGASPEIVGALVGGARARRRVRRSGSCARRRRCCRCASSATARSRSRTSRRSSCSSGCSARSSCSRSSSRPCRATRRSQSGLRILPWTAMPMFIAPIAGALSDRIGGQRLMGAGLALQAIGLAWIAAVSTPTTPYGDLVGAVRRSPASGWRSSSRRSRTSCSRRCGPSEEGQASGANNAIRELGGVFGVAVLASVFAHDGGYTSGAGVRRRHDAGRVRRRGGRRRRRARRASRSSAGRGGGARARAGRLTGGAPDP